MRRRDTINSILKHKGGEIWSVSPDQSVYEAIEKMADKGVGALLVISEDKLVGIISERDYARRVILKGRSSKDTQVKEIMTSLVIHVTPHQTLDECMSPHHDKSTRTSSACNGRRAFTGIGLDWRPGEVDHHRAGRDHPTTGALHRWKFSILNPPRSPSLPRLRDYER